MEINKLTQNLLEYGYTKENPPDWIKRPWNDFYGGWEYPIDMVRDMVFETPCGLLVEGSHFTGGHLSFMGVNWTVENDNPTVTCPKIFDGTPCELNHALLREHSMRTCHDRITSCASRLTDKPYDYEHSFKMAHNDVWAESKEVFKQFDERHKGRACEYHSHYSRSTKTWHMYYDPIDCARLNCNTIVCGYCKVLQKEVSHEKGNVYFDVKTTRIVKGFGLIPDERKTVITKGNKLLDRQTSLTICNAITKYAKHTIREKHSQVSYRERIDHPDMQREILNIRCEKRVSRDLLQDLQDIREGINVTHASDLKKAAAAQKHERKVKRQQAKARKREKVNVQNWITVLQDESASYVMKRHAERELSRCNINYIAIIQSENVEQLSLLI